MSITNKSSNPAASLIILNCKIDEKFLHAIWQKFNQIVICDGGYKSCQNLPNLQQATIIGDFDSINKSAAKGTFLHLKSQFTTDSEKALAHLVNKDITKVFIAGIAGGEYHHHLNNLYLLSKFQHHFHKVWLGDENQTWLHCRNHFFMRLQPKTKISFFALQETVKIQSCSGLQWQLDSSALQGAISISNSVINCQEKTAVVDIKFNGELTISICANYLELYADNF